MQLFDSELVHKNILLNSEVDVLKFKSPTIQQHITTYAKPIANYVNMGRYGLIRSPNEAYTNTIAIGTNVDPIWAHTNIKNVQACTKQKENPTTRYINIYIYIYS